MSAPERYAARDPRMPYPIGLVVAAVLWGVSAACRDGQSRQAYENRTIGYVGLDLSFGALCMARRKFPATSWGQADACRLPFTDCSFDAVAFSSVLHHVLSLYNLGDWIFERIGLGRWFGTFILTAGRKVAEARRA